ncbi:MAG: Ig-like domain-containing protein, partial [Myxococcota bacterium]|nr:Ig-like domain-containing protein [Myxococcota bacterium]
APVANDGGAFEADVALAEGANEIAVVARDADGNETRRSVRVVRDTEPPQLAVLSPTDGARVDLERVPVRGTASDPNGIASVAVEGEAAALDGVDFQALVPLAPGANTLRVVATDAAGNRTTLDLALERLVDDRVGPLIEVSQPADGALLGAVETTIAGRVLDASPLDPETPLTLDGEPVALSGERFAVLRALTEGPNLLTLRARDALGNESTRTLTITRDTLPPPAPAVEAVSPPSPTAADRVTLTLRAEPGARVAVAGGAAPAARDAAPADAFGLEVFLRPNAENRLLVTATDATGNTGAAAVVVVAQDPLAPIVELRAPGAGATLPPGTHDVVVAVRDGFGVASVSIDAGAAAPLGGDLYARALDFAPGPRAIDVVATDRAGNAASARLEVEVAEADGDDEPPLVEIVAPAAGSVAGLDVPVSVVAFDESAITGVTVAALGLETAVLEDGVYRATARISAASDTTIRVEATDGGGLVGFAEVVVRLDDGAPPAPALEPPASPTASRRVLLRGATEAGARVEVGGGESPASTTAAADGGFTVLVDLVPNASQTLSVVAVDAVGNRSPPATATVLHDDVAPELLASAPEAGSGGLAPDTAIALTFSEPLAAATVAGAVRLEVAGAVQPAALSLSGDRVVIVTPEAPLPTDTGVRVLVEVGIADRAGNPLSRAAALGFATLDTLAPATPVVAPAPPARTREDRVVLVGSAEPGVALDVSGGGAPAGGVADAAGRFSVEVALAVNAVNHLLVVARDAAGNASEPATLSIAQDRAPPTASFTPAPGSAGVDPAATLSVSFGEEVQLDSTTGRLTLRRAGTPVPGAVAPTAAGTALQLVPDAPLVPGAYELELAAGVRDTLGNERTSAATSAFTVAAPVSVPAPVVNAVAPPSPTAASAVTIDGTAQPGLAVVVTGPGGSAEVAAGADGSFRLTAPLAADRAQSLALRARDGAGELSDAVAVDVVQDATPPTATEIVPSAGARVRVDAGVSVTFSESVSAASAATGLELLLDGASVAADVSLSGGGRVAALTPRALLEPEQSYRLRVSGVADLAGNVLAAPVEREFVTAGDERTPAAPALDPVVSTTAALTLAITGEAAPGDAIEIRGGAAPAAGAVDADGRFAIDVELRPDTSNALVVTARNPANGLAASTGVSVRQDGTPPTLELDSPAEAAVLSGSPVAVTGRATDASGIASLEVAGRAVTPTGGRFSAAVELLPGSNTIRIAATDRAGNPAELLRQVELEPLEPGGEDVQAPVVRIDAPAAGSAVAPQVTVRGTVNDASTIVGMRVDGRATLPDALGRFASLVDLAPGSNTIAVEATDAAGNTGTAGVTVVVDAIPPVVTLDPLPPATPDPSVVVSGVTEPGAALRVEGGALRVDGVADAGDGRFSLPVTLRAETVNLLLVSAVDAVGNRGVPVDVAVRQDARGPTLERLEPPDGSVDVDASAPILAAFSDPLDPASVAPDAVVASDRDGVVPGTTTLSPGGSVLGFVPARPYVAASEVSVAISGALRDAGGLALGADALASFRVAAPVARLRGVVVDDATRPLAGVRVALEGTDREARSGAQGNFTLEAVPAGLQVLVVDGSEVGGGGRFSRILRDVQVQAGVDNVLGRPVTLTPIDRASARLVDGTRDQMLEFSGALEGFELEVFAESATFPDGKANGRVTATAVDPSHIPGRLPDGSAPALLVNLEPGGTEFDPPCFVRFPNRTGLAPGERVDIFSFEGSLRDFEVLCEGEVTADGSSVVSVEPCVEHFSFVGFFPQGGDDVAAPAGARAFLAGRVVDATGAGIPDVLVDVAASDSRVRTDADGHYTLPLPLRNLFALRVFALVPTSLGGEGDAPQLAAYQSEPVEPAPTGETLVPDIVVDRVFLGGDVSLVNQAGEFVPVGADTRIEGGQLVELSDADADAIRLFVLEADASGSFDPTPLAEVRAVAAPDGPFSTGGWALALVSPVDGSEAGAAPGDALRVVAFSPATGYTGWTDLRVPSIAEAGSGDLRVDLVLRPPEVALGVRRAVVD